MILEKESDHLLAKQQQQQKQTDPDQRIRPRRQFQDRFDTFLLSGPVIIPDNRNDPIRYAKEYGRSDKQYIIDCRKCSHPTLSQIPHHGNIEKKYRNRHRQLRHTFGRTVIESIPHQPPVIASTLHGNHFMT